MTNSWSCVILCLSLSSTIVSDDCCGVNDRPWPIYKFSKSNGRSNLEILARREFRSREECEKFAIEKRALAYNYRESRNRGRGNGSREANCQALECPEINGFDHLDNKTRFGYHSTYKPRTKPANGTLKCLPRVGIFHISDDRLNYTNAQSSCKNLGGNLARIISEERTEGLGKFVSEVPAFVGLSNRDKERIWKTESDEPLSCFDYRGWSVDEPAHLRGCVALSRPPKLHSSSSWRVLPCSQKSPYICEILPRFASKSHRRNDEND